MWVVYDIEENIMNVQSAFNSGVEGFQKATETANQAASSIASAINIQPADFQQEQTATDTNINQHNSAGELSDLNQSIVDLKVAEYQAKASAKVVKTADETLGTLLDVSV